ncbi:flagellar hook capping FlgD N-terminal domain-containing protein [Falsirhodobacter sp. 20TX0035]|uniref:flagellar hook capping FlgD N-terminal domain-containing protein n=1 Tax=Falsirhodobacter sp. 20TX0035 TaxID=3022019 RepID=UPI00232F211E|nr:flagellar hook capping FlgD N-terminal domain-containing protein [Falsirhodobacter sp. 20TX0035]MDB6452499.1 flagellar hook capping FlgD N-terminal domain-containing protein [Falsirhodobacter sp. 20TX0035]
MDVTSTTSVTTRTSSGGATKSGSTDYQTFLTMLTTQLKNQDPTSPMESTDFAVQLATFSGVEQQTLTNQILEAMGGKMDAMTLSDLSSWLGAQAMVTAPVTVDGSPVTLYPQFDAKADGAVLVVKDASGNTVARNTLDITAETVEWTPQDATGAALPSGRYTLSMENYSGETALSVTPVQHYAEVAEAKIGTDGTVLVLKDGTEVAAADVTRLKR